MYKDGIEKSTVEIYKSGRVVYALSETRAGFPGGIDRLYRFLGKNVRYPTVALQRKTIGLVHVQFIIEPDGTSSHLNVSVGIGDGCDEEALRVINLLPKWNPAMENGKAVASWHTLIIGFILDKKGRQMPNTFIDLPFKSPQIYYVIK